MCREIGLPLFPGFSAEARETLLHYRWPGNIRELKNVVERSVYRHGTSDYPLDEIIIDPFRRRHTTQPQAPETKPMSVGLPLDLREFQQQQEKDFLQTSLQQAKFNQKKAAELLGLTYHQLRALLKKHQI
jgi:psp operon transcriptional activator